MRTWNLNCHVAGAGDDVTVAADFSGAALVAGVPALPAFGALVDALGEATAAVGAVVEDHLLVVFVVLVGLAEVDGRGVVEEVSIESDPQKFPFPVKRFSPKNN